MRQASDARRRQQHAARIAVAAVVLATLGAPATVRAVPAASIADLELPPVTTSHVDQTNTGTMTLTVTDQGSVGWNATVEASAFAYSGSYGGTDIPAANFSITNAMSPVRVSGQEVDAIGGPSVPLGATGTLDVPRKTMYALIGYGRGTYRQDLAVSLVVPANSRAGRYTASLTVTASAGP